MTGMITKHNLFRPAQPKAETKSEITNSTARAIIKAEADGREAKTARLRQARLAMEAQQPAPIPSKTRGKKAPKQRAQSAA